MRTLSVAIGGEFIVEWVAGAHQCGFDVHEPVRSRAPLAKKLEDCTIDDWHGLRVLVQEAHLTTPS